VGRSVQRRDSPSCQFRSTSSPQSSPSIMIFGRLGSCEAAMLRRTLNAGFAKLHVAIEPIGPSSTVIHQVFRVRHGKPVERSHHLDGIDLVESPITKKDKYRFFVRTRGREPVSVRNNVRIGAFRRLEFHTNHSLT
jgi:hypothetical protein